MNSLGVVGYLQPVTLIEHLLCSRTCSRVFIQIMCFILRRE